MCKICDEPETHELIIYLYTSISKLFIKINIILDRINRAHGIYSYVTINHVDGVKNFRPFNVDYKNNNNKMLNNNK